MNFINFTFETSNLEVDYENIPKNLFSDSDGDALIYFFKPFENDTIIEEKDLPWIK